MYKLLLPIWMTLLFSFACPAQELASPESTSTASSADLVALRERLGEARRLLDVLDSTIARLSRLAEESLDRVDQAVDYDERARYEALYAETGARIGELQLQRDKIEELLTTLEAKVNHDLDQAHDR